ncbi:MAG TPA: hypothetical protein VFB71_12315 [Ramlibacter sp.]|nr:hypothetical protein [Ramlibacter sp.]
MSHTTPTPPNPPYVATEILRQLGGRQFLAMTGARDLLANDNSLQLRIGRNSMGVTHVLIELDPSDTYTVTTTHHRGADEEPVAQRDGIYNDQLRATFEAMTGLRTSL